MDERDDEPTLSDLLEEPATRLLMASDGVAADDIARLLDAVRERRRADSPGR